MCNFTVDIFEIRDNDDDERKLYIYIVRGYLNIIVAGPRIAHGSVLGAINKAMDDANGVEYNDYSVSKHTISNSDLMRDFREKVEKQEQGSSEWSMFNEGGWVNVEKQVRDLADAKAKVEDMANYLVDAKAKVKNLVNAADMDEVAKLVGELDTNLTEAISRGRSR